MDDAELVGGLLVRAADPRSVSRMLVTALKGPNTTRAALRRAGLDPDLVDGLRQIFGTDSSRIDQACREGAAWALGRRAVEITEPWELVATFPPGEPLPPGIHRATGETLIHIINGAKHKLRVATPFMDPPALAYLSDCLAGATARGVLIDLFVPTSTGVIARGPFSELLRKIRQTGDNTRLQLARFRDDAPWAHLKVITADSAAAYVGSANLTKPGLGGRNLEMGVFVRGSQVLALEGILDMFRRS